MSQDFIRIPTRWRGPAFSANGGYTCGLLAGMMGVTGAEITLRNPPPLERDLVVERRGEGVIASDGDTLVAEGRPAEMDLEVPAPPSSVEAAEASRAGYEHWAGGHAFPECAVCGPEREAGDGLRIFPGQLGSSGLYACAWTPESFVAGAAGTVSPEGVWAALDCPTAAPARIEPGDSPVVLGRLRVSLDGPVALGETHVILSWALEREGRKSTTAAALFDSRGRILGRARAVWIELRGA